MISMPLRTARESVLKAEWVALETRRSLGELLSDAERTRYELLLQRLPSARAEREWIDAAAALLLLPPEQELALQRLRQGVIAELASHPHLRLLSPPSEPREVAESTTRRAVPRVFSFGSLALGLALLASAVLWFVGSSDPNGSASNGSSAGSTAAPLTDGVATNQMHPSDSADPTERAVATSSTRAELFLAAGEVWVGGAQAALQLLASGEQIRTGAGTACLTLDPEIEVCFAEHTRATLSRLERRALEVRVETGTAIARLSSRSPGHEFTLSAADVRATAKGTVYSITRRGSEAPSTAAARTSDGEAPVEVTVLEGSVQISDERAGAVLVAPAHTRVRGGGTALTSEPVGRQSEGGLWLLLGSEQWLHGRQVGTLSVEAGEAADANALVLLDDEGPYRLPLHVVLPAGPHRLRRPGQSSEALVEIVAGRRTTLQGPEVGTSGEPAGSPDTAIVPTTETAETAETVPPRRASSPSAQRAAAQHLARAREHLNRGERHAALEAYRRLSTEHPASTEARTVAVTVAQLELELGSAARALRGFERYLASPGPLAPEALAGKVAALTALGRPAEARSAARSYLERYPRGTHAESMRRLSQTPSER